VEARKISQARGLEATDERGCSHTVQGEQQGVGLPHCIGSDTSRMDCEVGYVPPSSENDSNKITSQANNANDKGKNPVAVTNNAGLPNLKCWKRQARALKSNQRHGPNGGVGQKRKNPLEVAVGKKAGKKARMETIPHQETDSGFNVLAEAVELPRQEL
jgi:hypothetical protein